LRATGWELVTARGPLNEEQTLALVGEVDGYICGDDQITRRVLEKALPRLRVLSKYGIGVDKIDVDAATALGIPVCFTPGVNHTTVAEHGFALLLALVKNLVEEANQTRSGNWKRLTGNEILGKTMGIIGLGRIGREMAVRARAFGMRVIACDLYWDSNFAAAHEIHRCADAAEVCAAADIVSLHANLTDATRHMIDGPAIAGMKDGVIVINCARGELVDTAAMVAALRSGKVRGYGTDVLDSEPPPPDHPLLTAPNCIVTPHIGSRTYESVVRQATKSVQNLILAMRGQEPLAQVNQVQPRQPPAR
jgi:D-3-phosphoglycerate dehydrogenase